MSSAAKSGGVTQDVAPTPAAARGSPARHLTVALIGNPNTGKTTLFNTLTGLRQRVGNYPGVTVEKKVGHFRHGDRQLEVIDLPGTYSLAPRSPDEMVAVDLLLGHQEGVPRPDVIVSIVDASNLERNLYLTTQLLELGLPLVVALNMLDIAERQGRMVDAERVAKQLGLRIVPIQANKKRGIRQLKDAILAAAGAAPPAQHPGFPATFEAEVAALEKRLAAEAGANEFPSFLVRRMLLDVGGYTEQRLRSRCGPELLRTLGEARARLAAAACTVPAVEAKTRYAWIRAGLQNCIIRSANRSVSLTDRLDRILTHKVWGTLTFLLLMFVVFQSIFTWARPLMKLIGDGKDSLADLVRASFPPGPFTSLLADGILEGVGSVLVFLPQILILFGFIAILEDCGYMARAAFLMDKLMARCGLSGKSFIPLLSSVACAVPGIMATRVIENRRDRLATILVAPLMSCSARLPVYILLIGAFLTRGHAWWLSGVVMFCMYAIGLVVAPLMALLLKRTLLRGETPVFVMEMPVYKWPSVRTVSHRMFDSGWAFVRRAGTLILASMVLVWALLYFPRGDDEGGAYDERIAQLQAQQSQAGAEPHAWEAEINDLYGKWKRRSYLGQMGQIIEPAVRPLGWDWKIGMAALASFPAREVVVGTLGIIYNLGKVDSDEIRAAADAGETELSRALQDARWDDQPAQPVFSAPVALSIMVFFALCCQCASTLAVIRRETNSWRWPVFTFVYMTVLAYFGALLTFQIGSLFT